MKDVLAHIIQRLCTSQPLKYSDILDLDQRIREFNKLQNPYTKSSLPAEWARDTPSETMQRFCTLFFKDIGEFVRSHACNQVPFKSVPYSHTI